MQKASDPGDHAGIGGENTARHKVLFSRLRKFGFGYFFSTWTWFRSLNWTNGAKATVAVCEGFSSLTRALVWLVIAVLVVHIILAASAQRGTAIDPISVPKSLSENGLTDEIAA